MEEKNCTKCGKTKPIIDFKLRKTRNKTGPKTQIPSSWCIACDRAYNKRRMQRMRSTPEGRAKQLGATKRYRERVGGRKAARDRCWVEFDGVKMTHGEMLAIKRWRAEVFRREKERGRKRRAEIREQKRLKRIKEKPWLDPSLSGKEKYRLRYALDAEFNIKERLRAAMRRKRQGYKMGDLIRDALKRGGRSHKFEEFARYTTAELRSHLERQFTKGMSWEAFCAGEIHIDHIVPLDSFDLTDPDELRAAWAITNLRPLWAKDNLAKSNKIVSML